MIEMRSKTGWESYAGNPASFIQEVLKVSLSPRSKARCLALIRGNERRIGLVYRGAESDEDVATFAVGIAIWRACALGRSSILVGGRPSIAEGWHQHACLVLGHAASEIKRDVMVLGRLGLRAVNGAWILRYDGPLHNDYWASSDAVPGADVFFGDFEWINKDTIDEALDDATVAEGALSVLVVNGDA